MQSSPTSTVRRRLKTLVTTRRRSRTPARNRVCECVSECYYRSLCPLSLVFVDRTGNVNAKTSTRRPVVSRRRPLASSLFASPPSPHGAKVRRLASRMRIAVSRPVLHLLSDRCAVCRYAAAERQRIVRSSATVARSSPSWPTGHGRRFIAASNTGNYSPPRSRRGVSPRAH